MTTEEDAKSFSLIITGKQQTGTWHSLNGAKAPKTLVAVDDSLSANDAFKLVLEGTGLLWLGDYHNGRQMLSALSRRISPFAAKSTDEISQQFYKYRQARSNRSRLLGLLTIPVTTGGVVPLRRAPDIRAAWDEIGTTHPELAVVPFQDVLGAIGAHEWRKNGLHIEALEAKVHPHFGTFAPTRDEYLSLVAQTQLPASLLSASLPAVDIGTGTGVLAAILAKRGVKRVIAVDTEPRAIACATENIAALGYSAQVEVREGSMFPSEPAALIVCNPPWLPGSVHTLLDNAVYDPKSRMLKAFLAGLAQHLTDDGEGWLIISDLAERFGMRSREELLAWIDGGGLEVVERIDIRPSHRRSQDRSDPFHQERSQEITSLWRLVARDS